MVGGENPAGCLDGSVECDRKLIPGHRWIGSVGIPDGLLEGAVDPSVMETVIQKSPRA